MMDIMKKWNLKNAKRLEEIINTYGFPVLPLVKKEVNDAIFLIVQHAISYPYFIVSFYLTLKQLNEDEYNFVHYMYLEDRINFFLGLPQNYGTQFDYNGDGLFTVYKLASPIEQINKIRNKYNLPSIEEKYNELAKYQNIQLTPFENETRKREYQVFLHQTGWNKIKDRFTIS